jgi:hypothetical protein
VGLPFKFRTSFIWARLFSLSSLVVFFFALRLLFDLSALNFLFSVSLTNPADIPLFLLKLLAFIFLAFHFGYGLAWFQSVSLGKMWRAEWPYALRRVLFLPALAYFLISFLTYHSFFKDLFEIQIGLIIDIMGVIFVYYGANVFCDWLWDWGVMCNRHSWKIFTVIFCIFLVLVAASQTLWAYWDLIKGVA